MDINDLSNQFIERLYRLADKKTIDLVIQSFGKPFPLVIRTNTLKTTSTELEKEFTKHAISFKPTDLIANSYILKEITTREITELESYKKGFFYIQNLASMLPVLFLGPKPNEIVLDMAASPGSKTIQIAEYMGNCGILVANDISRSRLYKLKANLSHFGVTNTTLSNIPGQKIWMKYPEYFDRVLLDAPCSMEGRIKTNDSQSFKNWSMKEIKKLSKIQKWLLRAAISSTKPGGIIIYSTCTLAPEENEDIINWILEKEHQKISLENISVKDLPNYTSLPGTLKILPSNITEGFFIAKIKKNESTVHLA
jgi:NOL1/NOP2/sun family putative RNA methylase